MEDRIHRLQFSAGDPRHLLNPTIQRSVPRVHELEVRGIRPVASMGGRKYRAEDVSESSKVPAVHPSMTETMDKFILMT
jgi:hypothetical protein